MRWYLFTMWTGASALVRDKTREPQELCVPAGATKPPTTQHQIHAHQPQRAQSPHTTGRLLVLHDSDVFATSLFHDSAVLRSQAIQGGVMGNQSYLTLASAAVAELEVKRSRFVCRLAPITDENAARDFINQARTDFRDARHHCTAFILGETAMTRRSNDDGEPSGTAGAPILEALAGAADGQGVTYVAAVVIRWFGGTLLGTGGLTRAYGDATRAALTSSTLQQMTLHQLYSFPARHADAAKIENGLRHNNIHVEKVEYLTGHAEITIGISTNLTTTQATINQIATQEVQLTETGIRWVASDTITPA